LSRFASLGSGSRGNATLVEAGATLYVDAPRRPEMTGVPPGMPPVAGALGLWRAALETTFPEARIESAVAVIRELRWIKSELEVGRLRQNAVATVGALRAAAARIEPGVTQRQVEAAVVTACLDAGAQGPSFWPWAMSGPNSQLSGLVRAFYSYEHLDREMNAGELVRIDIGCHGANYGADVGRTLPVGGQFSLAQAELWDLLIAGYLAGLDAMADGVTVSEVRAASRARVRELEATMTTAAGRAAVEQLDDDAAWHLHGVGIDSGEDALPTLNAGAVIAYEPMLAIGSDAFYLEDMILVTASGHEVLSAGLPYGATAIADWMTALGPRSE
jgi:Xaa-Pro aminopeptidase